MSGYIWKHYCQSIWNPMHATHVTHYQSNEKGISMYGGLSKVKFFLLTPRHSTNTSIVRNGKPVANKCGLSFPWTSKEAMEAQTGRTSISSARP